METLAGKVLPLVLSLAKDPIPNVRVNSAKALKSCYPFVKEKVSINFAINIVFAGGINYGKKKTSFSSLIYLFFKKNFA